MEIKQSLKAKAKRSMRSSSCSQVRKARGVERRVIGGKGRLLLLSAWLGAGKRGRKEVRGLCRPGSWQLATTWQCSSVPLACLRLKRRESCNKSCTDNGRQPEHAPSSCLSRAAAAATAAAYKCRLLPQLLCCCAGKDPQWKVLEAFAKEWQRNCNGILECERKEATLHSAHFLLLLLLPIGSRQRGIMERGKVLPLRVLVLAQPAGASWGRQRRRDVTHFEDLPWDKH